MTSSLPRTRSTTELQQRFKVTPYNNTCSASQAIPLRFSLQSRGYTSYPPSRAKSAPFKSVTPSSNHQLNLCELRSLLIILHLCKHQKPKKCKKINFFSSPGPRQDPHSANSANYPQPTCRPSALRLSCRLSPAWPPCRHFSGGPSSASCAHPTPLDPVVRLLCPEAPLPNHSDRPLPVGRSGTCQSNR